MVHGGCQSAVAFPDGGDVAQSEPDQLRRRVVGGKCPRVLMILRSARARSRGVGGVDDPADVGRKREEGHDVRQARATTRRPSGSGLTPGAARERVERRAGGVRAGRRVDGRNAAASGFRSFHSRSRDCAAAVDDTRLQRGRGNTAARASLIPLSPSVTAMRMSWQPRALRCVNTFSQNFAPSVCSIQIPRMSRVPSGSTASARYTALLCTILRRESSHAAHRRRRPDTSARAAASARPTLPRGTAAVTVLIRSGETSGLHTCPTFNVLDLPHCSPRAYSAMILSSNPVNRRSAFAD